MIVSFSENIFRQILGIIRKNFKQIFFFVSYGVLIFLVTNYFNISFKEIPLTAVSILGGALAFFLAFRNNSAYDRWWEARKIWGGIVNVSRTFGGYATNFLEKKDERTITIVRRHLAWVNALRVQLRGQDDWSDVKHYLNEEDYKIISESKNVSTQIIQKQLKDIINLKRNALIDAFEHEMLCLCLKEMYDLQGKAERIKKTNFPYYYEYFTRIFLWVFILFLPLSLIPNTGYGALILSILTSFIFYILEKTGAATETPLDWNSSGTPMTTLCRVIENDVLQQLGSTDLPAFREIQKTRNGALFYD